MFRLLRPLKSLSSTYLRRNNHNQPSLLYLMATDFIENNFHDDLIQHSSESLRPIILKYQKPIFLSPEDAYKSIRNVIYDLNDDHSSFLTPEEYQKDLHEMGDYASLFEPSVLAIRESPLQSHLCTYTSSGGKEYRIGYVRLIDFQKGVADEFERILWELHSQGAEYLVLDLQDNGGGLFTEAVQIVKLWLGYNEHIYAKLSRSGWENILCDSDKKSPIKNVAVLIDKKSASSAEFVAAVIKSSVRGVIYGCQSYGKCKGQKPFELLDGSAVCITTYHWVTWDWESLAWININRVGVIPHLPMPETLKNGVSDFLKKLNSEPDSTSYPNFVQLFEPSFDFEKINQRILDYSSMSDLEKGEALRFQSVRSAGGKCTEEDVLLKLLAKKHQPICYDMFDLSISMPMVQCVRKMIDIHKLITDGRCKVKIWLADSLAELKNEMGGDMEKIQTVGCYMIEIWKAYSLNLDDRVEFLWSSVETKSRASDYWCLVMNIARSNNILLPPWILRCIRTICLGGRYGLLESQNLILSCIQFMDLGKVVYPCMQCADMLFSKADICRVVFDEDIAVLVREYCRNVNLTPVILYHHTLPEQTLAPSPIYMEDEEEDVKSKIKMLDFDVCLEYVRFICFPWYGNFTVTSDRKGHTTERFYHNFEEVLMDYEDDIIGAEDIKSALANAINKILQAHRYHFNSNDNAKALLEKIKGYRNEGDARIMKSWSCSRMRGLAHVLGRFLNG